MAEKKTEEDVPSVEDKDNKEGESKEAEEKEPEDKVLFLCLPCPLDAEVIVLVYSFPSK